MKLTAKLVATAIVPAMVITLAGWLYQNRQGRQFALGQAQASLDESARLTADLVDRTLASSVRDLMVLSTQSAFGEFGMYRGAGLLDEAEQQRMRIEEAALQLLDHQSAYRRFEYHDASGAGFVRVEEGRPVLRYENAAGASWFEQALADGQVVLPAGPGVLRIALRVAADDDAPGVVSILCSAGELLGPVLTYAAQTGIDRGIRVVHASTGLMDDSHWVHATTEEMVQSRAPLALLKGGVVEVRQPEAAAVAQYAASEQSFGTSLLIITTMLVLLMVLAFRVLVLSPLQRMHGKAQAFLSGHTVSTDTLPQRDELGDLDRALTGAVSRLTDAVASLSKLNGELESRVDERTAALTESEAKTRAIIEMAAEGIVTIDERGTIELFNATAERIFGYTAAEVLGKNVNMLMQQPHRDQHDGYLQRFAESGERRIIGLRREVGGLRKDGTPVPLELGVAEVTLGARRIFTGITRDITERKRAEEELFAAKEAAEAANRAKSEFLANMSHEIRTPMNGIIGMTELALGTALDPEQSEYLNSVMQSADSLLALLNDILDFSKIEAGRLELERVDFDLAEVIESVADVLAPRAAQKELELICELRPDVPRWLAGDPGRLRQVLVNLVGNAVKFTESGEVLVSVCRIRQDGDVVDLRFCVRDTGIGIPVNRQHAIFESFTQVDGATTRTYGGSGLGLTICRQIVELMEGELWVESTEGKGSEFIFELRFPCVDEPPATRNVPPASLQGYRILVVDDNQTNRAMLQTVLEGWSICVKTAQGGAEALKVLRAVHEAGGTFDVVLLDMQMPGMDGIAVAQSIVRDDAFGHPRLVLASSIGTRNEIAQSPDVAFAACLTKPIKQSVLRRTLASVLAPPGTATSDAARPTILRNRRRFEARVLLVEDNVVNQTLGTRILEKYGYDVMTAANGQIALEILRDKHFDVIFMDVQMPVMDGFEATKQIRRDARLRRLPVIAMTAHAMAGDRNRCLAAGMDDYITKPVKAMELREMVEKWTNRVKHVGANAKEETTVNSDQAGRAEMSSAIDVATALEQLGGDRELLEEVVVTFVETIPDMMAGIEAAVRDGDGAALKAAAHGIKGAAANIGAKPTQSAAELLELIGERGEMAEAVTMLGKLQSHLAALQAAVANGLPESEPAGR